MDKKTIEAGIDNKLSVIIPEDTGWEYRCNSCGQLRLFVSKDKPTSCTNCKGTDLDVDRSGKLSDER